MKTLFDTLYNATDEMIKAAKKPGTKKRIERGFESAIDGIDEQKIELDFKYKEIQREIANGEVKKITDLAEIKVQLNDLDTLAGALTTCKEEFNAEVKEEAAV